ncbi:unnamed protein product, partial [Porites lobata]
KKKVRLSQCLREILQLSSENSGLCSREKFKTKMEDLLGKPSLFRVDKIVAIKIDKVDKTSPPHPNVLIGKILHV